MKERKNERKKERKIERKKERKNERGKKRMMGDRTDEGVKNSYLILQQYINIDIE